MKLRILSSYIFFMTKFLIHTYIGLLKYCLSKTIFNICILYFWEQKNKSKQSEASKVCTFLNAFLPAHRKRSITLYKQQKSPLISTLRLAWFRWSAYSNLSIPLCVVDSAGRRSPLSSWAIFSLTQQRVCIGKNDILATNFPWYLCAGYMHAIV